MRKSPLFRRITLVVTAVACALTATVCVADAGGSTREVSYFSFFDGFGSEPYALDHLQRHLEPEQRLRCDPASMIRYRSKTLRYSVIVHPAFVERLQRFDALVTTLAAEHYGRAPRKLVHRGSFACRSNRANSERISEHALGNAIDFQGLDFGPLPRKAAATSPLSRPLHRAFALRVKSHWFHKHDGDAHHAAFLHALAETLRGRPDIFRGIVGPPRPRHADHLHFDVSPWRYSMFGYETPGS